MRALQAVALLSFLLFALSAAAQIPTAATGTVSGTVSDPTGAVVPGVEVQLLDVSTSLGRTLQTDAGGHYAFVSVTPGVYRLTATMQGFRQAVLPELKVEVGKAYTLNLTLEVGAIAQVVEVTAGVGVELQKVDATVTATLKGESLLRLPAVTRDLYAIQFIQPLTMPYRGSDATPNAGGVVAGARTDQNTYMLDGADITDNVIGAALGRPGGIQAVIPLPTESIEEFRVGATNPNATFGRSGGGQFAAVTKRGSNAFHGSAYWYHQNDNLNANTWTRKRAGVNPATGKDKIPEPEMKDNRFGFSLGGPIWKDHTFFYGHYEGRRFPQSTDIWRLVPTDTLRAGTLRFRDATGTVNSYPLTTWDPRGISLNPVVDDLWAYLPPGNNPSRGDGLNTIGFDAASDSSVTSDFTVIRIDHNFSDKWRFEGSYRYQRAETASATAIDIGGLLPDHTLGQAATVTFMPLQPRYAVGALTGQITPRLTNEFRVSWVRDYWWMERPNPFPQVPGTNVALQVTGNSGFGGLVDEPIDVHTQRARSQGIKARTPQFIDNATWIKGSHTILFGGSYRHLTGINYRNDKVVGSPSALVAELDDAAFITIPAANRPATCGAGVTSNCLLTADVTRWNRLYAGMLGMIDTVGVMIARDGELNPLPIGTALWADIKNDAYEFYFNDTWRVSPSFTLTLGVSYQWQTPPVEKMGRNTFLINNETGEILTSDDYLARVRGAALKGNIYNPELAYMPIEFSGRKRIFDIDWSNLGPRTAAAWNPAFTSGFLGRLFGDRKTVLRGGYSIVFDRLTSVQTGTIPMLGVGFAQTINVSGPNCDAQGTPGAGCDPTGPDPLSAFRIGVDGVSPLPTIPPVSVPVVPKAPFGEILSFQNDPNIKVGRTHSLDFTLQREMPWDMLFETGWVVRFGRQLNQNFQLSSVPYMHIDPASSQSLAQAFDLVASELRAGVVPASVTPQPWFENQVGAGRTVYFATNFTSGFIDGNLNSFWTTLQFLVPTPFMNLQVLDLWMRGDAGKSYYSGVFFTLHKRYSHGLTFDLNYTISKALDVFGVTQNYIGTPSSSFDLDIDYGPTFFDRRHVFNANWFYDLPFGRGRRFSVESGALDKLVGGWYLSGIFTANSGLPMTVCQGSYVFGSDPLGFGFCTGALPLTKPNFGNSVHTNVPGSGGVGTAGDPATGGSGLNLFADPEAVLESFRKLRISEDSRGGRGILRGLMRWNWDLSIGKRTRVTEQVQIVATFDFLNLPNRVEFANPSLNMYAPADFGVLSSQGNTPRAIQFGFRVEF